MTTTLSKFLDQQEAAHDMESTAGQPVLDRVEKLYGAYFPVKEPLSMRYVANRAHKVETTEAGPPGWRPDKEPCPEGMTLRERSELLRDSVAENPHSPTSRRFAVRRIESGLEFFTGQATQVVNGEVEYHGYPADHVPGKILRRFRDQGKISQSEYRSWVKRLG